MNKQYQESAELLTVSGKYDGFGAQLQAVMSGIVWCHYKRAEYVHTPFYWMSHAVGMSGEEYAAKMDQFCGMGQGSRLWDELTEQERSSCAVVQYIGDVHWAERPSVFYTDEARRDLMGRYLSSAWCKNVGQHILEQEGRARDKEIVIHIRRGDVTPVRDTRYTSNKEYLVLMDQLLHEYGDRSVRIISDGKRRDFEDIINLLGEHRVQIELGGDPRIAFHKMVTAKVLVVSRSSFAYAAALLNQNIVRADLIGDWWHKPLDHWVNGST